MHHMILRTLALGNYLNLQSNNNGGSKNVVAAANRAVLSELLKAKAAAHLTEVLLQCCHIWRLSSEHAGLPGTAGSFSNVDLDM